MREKDQIQAELVGVREVDSILYRHNVHFII